MRTGRVRIIAGTWRSRRVRVLPGVRPTQDAMRETLFNVLHPLPTTGRCLDLYAGSGSLGLEALSRGLAAATFVDHSAKTNGALRATLADFDATALARVIQHDALAWLGKGTHHRFDLVFADPPYTLSGRPGWWTGLLERLRDHLAPAGRVCLEGPAQVEAGPHWQCLRAGRNGAAHWCVLEASA